jgi:type I restriction enzyme S subunit
LRLRFYNDLGDNCYLYYLTKTSYFKDSLSKYITGQQPNYGYSHYSKIPIPLPPLPEQQRIVSILDEAFAAIAIAMANAEQNLKNAKELFESYLQGVFENKGEGWEEKRFDEICILQRGFDLPTHSRIEGNFPLVSSNGITDRIDLFKVKAPGVVTGRSGIIGKVHFIEEDYWPLNTSLYIKEFHGNYERFIYFFLKQFDLGKYRSGAGVPTLNRNNVHIEMVWFPKSISEQKAIVQKLDFLSIETKKLESIYQQKINDLEELKKSVLQKAFNGQLKMES